MALTQARIKEVIVKHGELITINTLLDSDKTYDEDTGWSTSTSGTQDCYAVPYDYFRGAINYQQYGNLPEGSIRKIIPGDVTIAEEYTFTYNGKNYSVSNVEPIPYKGEILAYIVDGREEVA